MKCYPFTVSHDFAHDFIRKLVFCSTNFITIKNIDVCFQKLLSCLSNIFFNVVTCSVTHLHTTQPKVNKLKFAYVLNNTCLVTWYMYIHNESLALFPRKGFVFLEKDGN